MKIALIGVSGNIGMQVCEIVRRHPDLFCFSALIGGQNGGAVEDAAREFHPALAGVAEGAMNDVEGVKILTGEDVIDHCFDGCDVAFIAAGGFAGLRYTLQAAKQGKKIALANKESLVCGGELVNAAVEEHGVDLVPVDSEHSAIFQALSFSREAEFESLILTASGGPFLHHSVEELARVTAKDALKHPTWNMGSKITIDSATLLNKGYEVIEAKWLYHTTFDKIHAVVHPESIVHSLVRFQDGALIAQLGYPDMRLPIQLALTYPKRLACTPQLHLEEIAALHFERLPVEKFLCFTLALEAGQAGGTCPTVLNGAAEVAVHAFLKGGISFPQIAETISCALNAIPRATAQSYECLKEADGAARRIATQFIYGK